MKADRCDIYTDVEGVYAADPRIVPKIKKAETISYEEMLELARAGANVLHPRSVETAKQFNVPLRVRSSFKLDNMGTLIIGVDNMEIYKPVAGAAADLSQTRILLSSLPDIPGTAAKLFGALAQNNISVDMIIQSLASRGTNSIAFTVANEDLKAALDTLNSQKDVIKSGEMSTDEDIAKVSIVGAGMVDRPGIAADMFRALAEKNINIKMISTSEIKISCLVEKKDAKEAVKALCSEFGLEAETEASVKGTLPDV